LALLTQFKQRKTFSAGGKVLGFSLYTIAAENPFLRVLAKWLLNDIAEVSRATILVPNRRSARALEAVLLQESGRPAMLLPNIKPIGDIDEDLIADSVPETGIADALSKTAHLHAILNVLMQWARTNPNTELAQDVSASGAQAFALAQSLQQLVNQFETEDVDVSKLQSVYDLDLAGHRQNILDLLKVITAELPILLSTENLIGPSARRNAMIRLEAERIRDGKHKGAIIAAGSTGTNPATRDLLKAIALHPHGTVVLPGLDLVLDDAAWMTITSEHPQYSLKSMLDNWGVTRSDVQNLGAPPGRRMWVMGQALRPAAVAEHWFETLKGQHHAITHSLEQVELVEAADRQQEAEVIALALRRHVAEGTGKAAVMTPDRDLATRITSALQRWNLPIDDSAGEPLVHTGRAALLLLLLQTIEERFSSSSLFALLYHQECHFGLPRDQHLQRVRALELIAFRGLPEPESIQHLTNRITAQRTAFHYNLHAHPLLRQLTDMDWASALRIGAELIATLMPLADAREMSLYDHITRLKLCLETLSPLSDTVSAADQLFLDVLTVLQDGSSWHPVLPLSKAQHSIIHALAQETLRPPFNPDSQLAIYGLAEARLVDVDLLILGGLSEGAWPERPESGPWLNRPMRETLKLQQPERDIGVTAHDFVQGFGHPKVIVTWPKRLNGAPAIPSRWVLRLQAVAMAAGLEVKDILSTNLTALASQLDQPKQFRPLRPPAPKPPVDTRPTVFSVTRVEKLIRDSYHVYAQKILRLEPLDPIGQDVDARLRGSLIHKALQNWITALEHVPDSERLHVLLLKGNDAFAPYIEMPEVKRFWWPRFERMATEFIDEDRTLRQGLVSSLTEITGRYECEILGKQHLLTAQADRIDILENGALRIIDYKSGQVPSIKQVQSGLAPQLSLEALIATEGHYKTVNSNRLHDVIFIAVGGGSDGVKITSLASKTDLTIEIEKAKAGFLKLLTDYQNPDTAYLPRHNMVQTDDVSDYDHLSRKLEWQMEGSAL
jgi:ATP-dependent helicase/nuclease subunit B